MKLQEVVTALDAEILSGEEFLEREVETCCGSDLMSDVLAFTKHNTLLCTGLTNLQVIRTADMTDLSGIVLVRGKRVALNFLQEAESQGLPVLTTKHTMFEACGILWEKGLRGCSGLKPG
jgi:predicted transcriptional regulator